LDIFEFESIHVRKSAYKGLDSGNTDTWIISRVLKKWIGIKSYVITMSFQKIQILLITRMKIGNFDILSNCREFMT